MGTGRQHQEPKRAGKDLDGPMQPQATAGQKKGGSEDFESSREEARRHIAFLKEIERLNDANEAEQQVLDDKGWNPGNINMRYEESARESEDHNDLTRSDVALLESVMALAGAGKQAKEAREKALDGYLKSHTLSDLDRVLGALNTVLATVGSIKGAYNGIAGVTALFGEQERRKALTGMLKSEDFALAMHNYRAANSKATYDSVSGQVGSIIKGVETSQGLVGKLSPSKPKAAGEIFKYPANVKSEAKSTHGVLRQFNQAQSLFDGATVLHDFNLVLRENKETESSLRKVSGRVTAGHNAYIAWTAKEFPIEESAHKLMASHLAKYQANNSDVAANILEFQTLARAFAQSGLSGDMEKGEAERELFDWVKYDPELAAKLHLKRTGGIEVDIWAPSRHDPNRLKGTSTATEGDVVWDILEDEKHFLDYEGGPEFIALMKSKPEMEPDSWSKSPRYLKIGAPMAKVLNDVGVPAVEDIRTVHIKCGDNGRDGERTFAVKDRGAKALFYWEGDDIIVIWVIGCYASWFASGRAKDLAQSRGIDINVSGEPKVNKNFKANKYL